MNNLSDERLASLVDDELDEHGRQHAIDALLKDAELRAGWGRYHLATDVLHNNLPEQIDPGFAARVMNAIERQPTILAPPPLHRPQAPAQTRPAVVAGAGFGNRISGMAVAASVAVLAVLGVQTFYGNESGGPQTPVVAASDKAAPADTTTLARLPQTPMPGVTLASVGNSSVMRSQDHPAIDLNRIDPRLHKYLINHSQQVSRVSLQGAMPYARIVAHPGIAMQQPVQQ